MNKFIKIAAKRARKYLPRYYDPSRPYRGYYDRNYDHAKIEKNSILYEVRDGQSMTDSPLFIFLSLIEDDKYKKYKHIWVIRDGVDEKSFIINVPREYRNRIELVQRNTILYAKWLLKAEYLITNSTFQNFFHKRRGQHYINTWHGTPLKFMGYDVPGSKTSLKNVQRNFMMTDFLISPNKHTTNLFLNKYKLNGMYEGTILESGYPRNDILFDYDESVLTDLRSMGIHLNGKPIVLYTPTWKGTAINSPAGSMEQILAETNILQTANQDKQILVKVHPYAYRQALREPQLSKILIPDVIDANRILSIVDTLVTDYSSIFFDFLITNRPIVFYSWDKEQYDIYRGMYLDESDLPAPVLNNINEVADYISKNYDTNNNRYQSMKLKMTSLEDGLSTQRVIDRIFDQVKFNNGREIHLRNSKKKVLIFTGGMINNGITTSLQNLTRNIDYDKYDVSVITWDSNTKEKVDNVNRLDEHVRILYRFGWSSFTFVESFEDKFIQHFGIKPWNKWLIPVKGYKRDIHRLIGETNFDAAIDFSGYSYNGSRIIAFLNASVKSVFQHNDLWADAHKVIKGKQPNKRGLLTLFSLYYKYDHVVSVSEKLADINAVKLERFTRKDQQSFSKNTLNLNQYLDEENDDFVEISTINEGVVFKKLSVTSYEDLTHYYQGNSDEIYYDNEDKYIGITKITFDNGVELVKLIKNNLPYVWVEMKDIEFTNEIIITEEQYDRKVFWINKNRRNVYENIDKKQAITRGWLLNNSFAKSEKIVKTNVGEYIKFKIPGSKQYGFIDKRSIKWLNSDHLTFMQKIWNIRKHGEDSFDSQYRLICYIGDENQTSLWSEPPKVSSKSILINNKNRLNHNNLYLVNASSVYKNVRYFRIIDEDGSFWINDQDLTVLDFHESALKVGIDENTLLSGSLTDDGRKISRDDFGVVDKDNNIQILSITDEIYKTKNTLMLNPVKNVFYWSSKKLTMNLSNSYSVISTSNKEDVKNYIDEIQAKFAVDTKMLDQTDAIDILKIKRHNNNVLKTRKLDNFEIKSIENKFITIFDDINGNILYKHLEMPDFIHVSRFLIQGGDIWFNGIDPDGKHIIFTIEQDNMDESKEDMNIFLNKLIYMSMGRLSPEKNHISLLIAFKKVLLKKPNARLWILGDGKMRQDLEKLTVILNIEKYVVFWGFNDNPQEFLQKSDVFVHPSYFEGQPMVLLEALNQNALVVASNITANVAVIGNQEYGLIMKDVSSKAIEDGMFQIVDNNFEFDIFDENLYNQAAIDHFSDNILDK
ncbi:glycosyltransferase [Weissella coleopterorum]|uniref:Glycosyltransferase n=1 Tax=Weissella coleopterorum TaxID=2714949 RepID=A0A6G8B0G0_9LACO|nr:CDP-glycerol glycerophosphotransferase family protein [Weissella coleopterorum]QIL50798.1 glycosyltransferase [Weissella coleopterorum]